MRRMNNVQEEELLKRQAIEKRSLPKRIRSEMKTRELMFRESLRISIANLVNAYNGEEERDKLKRFQESEKQRYKAEHLRQEQKHKKQVEELKNYCSTVTQELEEIHKDKRKALTEHETVKLKLLEEESLEELNQWRAQLKPRKQVMCHSDELTITKRPVNGSDNVYVCRNWKRNLQGRPKNRNDSTRPQQPPKT